MRRSPVLLPLPSLIFFSFTSWYFVVFHFCFQLLFHAPHNKLSLIFCLLHLFTPHTDLLFRKMVALETVPENNLNPAPPGGLKPLGKMTSDPANGQEKENATAPPKKNKRSRRRKSKNQEQKKGGNEEKTEMKKLTPYQGPFSTCGMFHCQDCDREWFSAHSWADSYQKCNECNKGIYPYRQFPRRRSEGPKKEEAPPHPQGMCQKCMKLGHSCVKLYVDKTRSSAESFRREE